jgi:hypothetical protein
VAAGRDVVMTTGLPPVVPTCVPSRLTACAGEVWPATWIEPPPLPLSFASQAGRQRPQTRWRRRACAGTVSAVKLSTTARLTSSSFSVSLVVVPARLTLPKISLSAPRLLPAATCSRRSVLAGEHQLHLDEVLALQQWYPFVAATRCAAHR